jgi:hypothetical protein
MCIIAAKYFKNKGWVLAKNRDQDYVSDLSFRDEKNDKVGEILVMYDHDIDYQEGMNHDGLVIITTSLTPQLSQETNKEDGDRIYKALHMSQKDAASYLMKEKMTGFIFLATPEKLMLIEAAKMDDGKGEYKAKIRQIPTNELVVRTNHGVDLPWAGFQPGITSNQDMWRKSSESRKKLAEQAVAKANTPEEMLDALASRMDKNLQMNLFRIENKPRQMRTIFQWALVPSEGIAYIRPIQVKMKLKVSHDKLQVRMVDNEIIKKTYSGRVKHFSRIKELNGGTEFKTIQTENWMYFKDYLTSKTI